MADRKLPPRDKRVLVRFLQRSKAEADAATQPQALDGEAAAEAEAQGAASAAGATEAQQGHPEFDGRRFVEVLETEHKLPESLHRLVTNAMTWSPPNEPVNSLEGERTGYGDCELFFWG